MAMNDKVKAEEAMRELTLVLLYLSRFAQGEKFEEKNTCFIRSNGTGNRYVGRLWREGSSRKYAK